MIPKTIHYCWFGGKAIPPSAKKCIKSWKKYCKGYKIIKWDESNFDISSAPLYVRQAYETKKWAFVTDYVRLAVVFEYGGIYFDTDVEVIRSFDPLLKYQAFFGFEDNTNVATGLGFGSESKLEILKRLMQEYNDIPFIKDDGSFDNTPCTKRNTKVFIDCGLNQNGFTQKLMNEVIIFSKDYFCPKSFVDGIIRITENTYCIHHFDASWLSKEALEETHNRWKRKQKRAKQKARRAKAKSAFVKVFGENTYKKIRRADKEEN